MKTEKNDMSDQLFLKGILKELKNIVKKSISDAFLEILKVFTL